MADDRPGGAAGARSDEDIHDDDELAAALAAELQRIAPTGAVPVLRASAVPFGPVAAPPVERPLEPQTSPRPAAEEQARLQAPPPVAAVAPSRSRPRPPEAPVVAAVPAAPVAASGRRANSRRRSGRPESPVPPPPERTPATAETPTLPPARPDLVPQVDEQVRPAFLAPRPATGRRADPSSLAGPSGAVVVEHHRHADTAPRHAGGDRGPQRSPSFSTTSEERPGAPVAGRRRARVQVEDPPYAAPLDVPDDGATDAVAGPAADLPDPLRSTGPLSLPPTLYESWEQSLRSIGRPRFAENLDLPAQPGAGEDTPTMTMSRAALGLPPAPAPAPETAVAAPPEPAPEPEPEPAAAPAPLAEPEPAELEQPQQQLRRRRRRARSADDAEGPREQMEPWAVSDADMAVGIPAETAGIPAETRSIPVETGAIPVEAAAAGTSAPAHAEVGIPVETAVISTPALPSRSGDDDGDGVDEVATDIRAVSAAETASIPLPPLAPQAATPTGSVAVAQPARPPAGATLLSVLLLWCGAFASPALLLTGFGLAVADAGGAAAGALVLGVAIGLPAAVRLTGAVASDGLDAAAVAIRVFGPRSGLIAAAVLVAARLLAAVLALLAVGDLAAAFAIRTGAGGASGPTASVVAVLVAGLAALAAVAWSGRPMRILLGVLSGVALVLTVLVLVVIAPAAGMPMPGTPPAHTAVIAWAAGFAVVGLFLVVTAADLVPMAAGRSRSRGLAAATVLSGLAGLVVLVLALAVGRGAAVEGDAATALAGVIADATPAGAAGPLAIALLIAAIPLPALLLRTAGGTAAQLIGSGRSARLGAVAAALLALAVALALLSGGVDATTAFVTAGPVLAVPVAVWAGVVTAAALRSAADRAARSVAAVGSAIAVLVGWLLTDGLGTPGERSPLLGLLHLPADSALRQSPALGLLIAFVLGIVAALVARIAAAREAAPPASRMRTEQPQPVDSVEA